MILTSSCVNLNLGLNIIPPLSAMVGKNLTIYDLLYMPESAAMDSFHYECK
jgi:hypothetical protein